jgi:putative long chain acyl-CoA synthase
VAAGSKSPAKRRSGRRKGLFRRLSASARNAVEVMRIGRLGAPYSAAFEVVHEDRVAKLRHYLPPRQPPEGTREWIAPEGSEALHPLLLVPPLMVTSEVYDISPELSAVTQLALAGVDVWLVDFGAPERAEGGMDRTLDDHVRAVDEAITQVRERTGRDVHLAGYSQGGMFCYQAAALRRSAGVRSILTFGSPVDIRRMLPGIGERAAERLFAAARRAIERPLRQMESLPGFLTSTGFKVVAIRKEVQQLVDFVQKLHDRNALVKRESRRRFLGGEGFVAWPGPALRKFVDEFIVHNRMASGGFVIDGRTVTLADLTVPILYFVGDNDEIARAPSVRAIRDAAPAAEIHEIKVRAGHFGLVVGTKANTVTWPSVIEWIRWKDALAERPAMLRQATERRIADDIDDEEFDDVPVDVEAFYDVATTAADAVMNRLGDVGRELGELVDSLRWQVPRLQKLRRIEARTRVSVALALADQAAAIPESTFFLWKGRAFTYKQADRRVDAVVRGLIHCGVRKGSRVGVLMDTRPSYLSIVCALNRMGAVAVLLSPDSTRITLEHALTLATMEFVVSDPAHAARARELFAGPVLALGGGPASGRAADAPQLPEGVLDMEAIDPASVELPSWYEPNAGQAADLAMIVFTAGRSIGGRGEVPKAARISNRRWAFSALGAAATCTLTSDDTVYCCLPLHHAAGMLVAVGGALVGGSRLALARRFDPETFWPEVRRNGASVVFYAGDMLRALVDAPATALDAHSPVRLFAGSGMRTDVWERLGARFGRASVLEFYATTEGNAVLANASGAKVGALGRPLPGSTDMALVSWDFEREDFARDETGHLLMASIGEPGVLIARIEASSPTAAYDGFADQRETATRILRGVFEPQDAWFVSGDLMRRDAEGDYWFVDRLADVVRTPAGPVPTIAIEDSLARTASIAQAAVYGMPLAGSRKQALVATVVLAGDLDVAKVGRDIASALVAARRPSVIRIARTMPMTDGFRAMKAPLKSQPIEASETALVYDASTEAYAPIDRDALSRALGEAPSSAPASRHDVS